MDLLDGKRRLLCASKLFRRSDSAFERGGQIELFVLLFDNYRQCASLSPISFWLLTVGLRSRDNKTCGEGAGRCVLC